MVGVVFVDHDTPAFVFNLQCIELFIEKKNTVGSKVESLELQDIK